MNLEVEILTTHIRNGDWAGYHMRRAASYRKAVARWEETARSLANSNPDMAAFAMARAEENCQWAEESEQKAQEVAA